MSQSTNPDARVQALERMLETATVRLELCLSSIHGCRADHPDAHQVRVEEIPAWIEEQRAALSGTPEQPASDAEGRTCARGGAGCRK